jgi:hypothetical protein
MFDTQQQGSDPDTSTARPDPATEIPLERVEAQICELAGHLAAATCRFLVLLGDFDARRGWASWEMNSCAQWLSWKCQMGSGTAREHVRVARALRDLPVLRAEFGAGRLSYAKIRALTRIATPATEAGLAEIAGPMTGNQLERFARAHRQVSHADDTTARIRRRLAWRFDDDGSLAGTFRLPPLAGAVLLKALRAAAADLGHLDHDHDDPGGGQDGVPAETPPAGDEHAGPPGRIGEVTSSNLADALLAIAETYLAGLHRRAALAPARPRRHRPARRTTPPTPHPRATPRRPRPRPRPLPLPRLRSPPHRPAPHPVLGQRRTHRPGQPDQPLPSPPHAHPRPRLPHRHRTRRRVHLLPARRHPAPAQSPAPGPRRDHRRLPRRRHHPGHHHPALVRRKARPGLRHLHQLRQRRLPSPPRQPAGRGPQLAKRELSPAWWGAQRGSRVESWDGRHAATGGRRGCPGLLPGAGAARAGRYPHALPAATDAAPGLGVL